MEANGTSSLQNKGFRQEKREFWQWPVLLAIVVLIAFNIYQDYKTELQTKETGTLIEVPVIQKIRSSGSRGSKSKIGIMHGHVPIYVVAKSKAWFRSATVGSTIKVIYSSRYHTYLDPNKKKFDVEISFIAFFSFVGLMILWRWIWLGLYIWYWK
ncbi:hypothetical protein DSL64_10020 [Dyadobacter luteus]|uniref:DUF3592 domain-containing protein n=1 Tax=Dyadobacter luteus TaxID=2259619 RepID=A0A3D8YC99_9BACT|nr:hypothetical protein [Dyadobacter luteus]REA61996.1 hypothetical protein DSL64_10020 [Dyadobacter luteus]